jgi:hypothetical protein
MRVGAPDELSAVLLAERLGRDRCRIGQQSDDSRTSNKPRRSGAAVERWNKRAQSGRDALTA